VGLLLTRAEEGGFGGMLGAVQGRFLDRDALYVNIECSSAKAGAPLGAGPVVRVGDRRWVFDPAITAALTAAADELVAAGTGLQYQRKLMDGGTCEATVLMQAGFRSGAVALPLRHYHNHGGDRLRPEAVHLDDLRGLVVLLLYLAARPGGPAAALAAATAKLRGDMARSRQIMVPRLRGDRPRVRNQR
jgi:endoglucanase